MDQRGRISRQGIPRTGGGGPGAGSGGASGSSSGCRLSWRHAPGPGSVAVIQGGGQATWHAVARGGTGISWCLTLSAEIIFLLPFSLERNFFPSPLRVTRKCPCQPVPTHAASEGRV